MTTRIANSREVSPDLPNEVEAELNNQLPKRRRAVSLDELPPVLLTMGGEVLIKALTTLFRDISSEQRIL